MMKSELDCASLLEQLREETSQSQSVEELAHVSTGVCEDGHLGKNLGVVGDVGFALPIPEAHEGWGVRAIHLGLALDRNRISGYQEPNIRI